MPTGFEGDAVAYKRRTAPQHVFVVGCMPCCSSGFELTLQAQAQGLSHQLSGFELTLQAQAQGLSHQLST